MRRVLEEGTGQEDYSDEPAQENTGRAIEPPPGNNQDQGPRVVPSSLINTRNEWRDEGEGHAG